MLIVITVINTRLLQGHHIINEYMFPPICEKQH